MATARHKIANLVSVPFTLLKFSFMKLIYPKSFHFHLLERFSPNVVMNIDRKSRIWIGNHVSVHSRSRISSVEGGNLIIGENCSFNVGCIITCRKKIDIGRNVTVGPNVMMFDHDHIMDPNGDFKKSGFRLGDITIGANTWIGAGTIILRNTTIGSNCIIAAGSVVKGNIPDNTTFVQKKENYLKNE